MAGILYFYVDVSYHDIIAIFTKSLYSGYLFLLKQKLSWCKGFFQKGKVHHVDRNVLSIYFPYSKYNGVIAMEHQLHYKGVDAEYLSTYQD